MRVRVRQHVNPLCVKYQSAIAIPDWNQVYAQVDKPLYLDLGCARGRFILEMAQLQPDINFLGIEIREPLVTEANEIRDQLGLTNLYYLYGNINYQPEHLLQSIPQNRLEMILIQFPDPWFKKRHQKRRVVQSELVAVLVKFLAESGQIFLQSDIKEVATEMRDRFAAHPQLQLQHQETWLADNPLSVATEREIATLAKGEPVYRALFRKLSLLELNTKG